MKKAEEVKKAARAKMGGEYGSFDSTKICASRISWLRSG